METPTGFTDSVDAALPPPPPTLEAGDIEPWLIANRSTLWRRAGAISVDAFVWLLIAIPISAGHPALFPGNGFHPAVGFTVNGKGFFLSGIPLLVTLVAWLAYMAVMEATAGGSVGKLLTGIRVVTYEGGRPGWGAAVARTLMRFVDELPAFYLLGGIVAAKSSKRQRLGDLVARTLVVKASAVTEPMAPALAEGDSRPWPMKPAVRAMTLALALVVLSVGGYVVLTRPEPGTFDRYGIAFHFPESWKRVDVLIKEAGNPSLFSEQYGLDTNNYVAVAGYHLFQPVTPENEALALSEFNSSITRLVSQLNATDLQGPESTRVAGYPSIRFSFAYPLPGGILEVIDSRILLVDQTEYQVSCEYTPDHAQEMQAGCQQAWATIQVG